MQKTKEEFAKHIEIWKPNREERVVASLEALTFLAYDLRDLLTEQSKKQRVEKPKVCNECNGRGFVARLDDEIAIPFGSHVLIPKKVPCPLCSNPQN